MLQDEGFQVHASFINLPCENYGEKENWHEWASVRCAGHTLNLVCKSERACMQQDNGLTAANEHTITHAGARYQYSMEQHISQSSAFETAPAIPSHCYLGTQFRKKFLPADDVLKVQSTVQTMALAAKKKLLYDILGTSSDSSTSDEEKQQVTQAVQKEVLMYFREKQNPSKDMPFASSSHRSDTSLLKTLFTPKYLQSFCEQSSASCI
ncbi:hypothetical protein H4Q32_030539 [Labeo rohita]|uniref:Zinc finger BED domain-containing 1-like protein n=1 Tax=Labeo rohita TaxID=84645 RepID=A0ABQ8L1I9_LABRO|nr:hypothetical protein H4Q32_030539 [Labeo rohita]